MTTQYEIGPAELASLLLLPTMSESQGDDLKLEVEDPEHDTAYRVWVPRMTDADRAEYADRTGHVVSPVEVERRNEHGWFAGAQSDLDRALSLAGIA